MTMVIPGVGGGDLDLQQPLVWYTFDHGVPGGWSSLGSIELNGF